MLRRALPLVLPFSPPKKVKSCAKLVMAAHRIAAENEHICAHMIDANLYPALVSRYRIERVPVLTVDGAVAAVGGMTLAELCALLRKKR